MKTMGGGGGSQRSQLGVGGVGGCVANNAEFGKVQIPRNLMSALDFRRAERQRRRKRNEK